MRSNPPAERAAAPAPARRGPRSPITEAEKEEIRLALRTYLKRYLVA
jgi:hypothetical protein